MKKPNTFATINGVQIYHVHKNGYGIGSELNYHYSTSADKSDHCARSFDIRDLGFSESRLLTLQNDYGIETGYTLFSLEVKRFIAQQIERGNIKAVSMECV